MKPTAQQILEEVSHLSPIDRAELVERIIESFDAGPDDEIKKSWADEAERRLALHKGGDDGSLSEQDVLICNARYMKR
ncbi:MAG: hypothetical protein A2176_00505 [Spirochaetes bacterium RBG_13_51_14]|nr:MAG: hypothetical protein A2176_00505 [Spirochaetes bacterium RBG_13_51_14]